MYSEIKFAYLENSLLCCGRRGVIWDPSLSGSFHWDSRVWASRSCRLVSVNVHALVGVSYFSPWMCSQKNARTTESRAGKYIWESPCVHTLGVHTYHSALVEVRGRHQMSFLTFCLMYATTYGKLTGSWNFRNSYVSTFHLAGEPLSSQICAGMSSLYMGLVILSQLSHHTCMAAICPTEQSC